MILMQWFDVNEVDPYEMGWFNNDDPYEMV